MNRIDLCGTWKFRDEAGIWHQGTVPGCVHTDLFSPDEMLREKKEEFCLRNARQTGWKSTAIHLLENTH